MFSSCHRPYAKPSIRVVNCTRLCLHWIQRKRMCWRSRAKYFLLLFLLVRSTRLIFLFPSNTLRNRFLDNSRYPSPRPLCDSVHRVGPFRHFNGRSSSCISPRSHLGFSPISPSSHDIRDARMPAILSCKRDVRPCALCFRWRIQRPWATRRSRTPTRQTCCSCSRTRCGTTWTR